MSKRSSDDLDNDHTDELPVLLESVMLEDESLPFAAADRVEDTNEHTALYRAAALDDSRGAHTARTEHPAEVADLEKSLAALTERNHELERLLADREALITELRRTIAAEREQAGVASAAERRLATQLAVRDARVAELTAAIEKLQDDAIAQQTEIAGLRSAAETAQREVAALQSELQAIPAPPAPAAASELQELLEANAALRDYIEGRRARWDEIQASQATLQAKIGSLEGTLATAAKRALEAEAFAARESSRAIALRAELVESARRVTVLERELRNDVQDDTAAASGAPTAETAPSKSADVAASPLPNASAPGAGETKDAHAADREQRLLTLDAALAAAPAVETLAQLEGEVEYKRQQIAAQLVELHDRDQRLLEAASELDRLRREMASLRNELDESRATAARLERTVIDKDRALDARDQRITTLQDELKQRLGVIEKLHSIDLSLSKLDVNPSRPAAADPGTDNAAPALLCLTGDAPKRFALTLKTTTVGRGPQCDLQILTHFVSREHARITVSGSAVLIEDLGSRNGVFINSVRIDRHALQHGDLVTIGETQFRFMESMAH